jgi:transketolase N-terminal domain/subunit
MPMGMADVATVLFEKHLRFDAAAPDWPDRDRFILSAGHGSMLLYSLLYLTGSPDMTLEQVKNFRQLGSITAGHPNTAMPRGSRRRPARWVRASPIRWASPSPRNSCAPSGAGRSSITAPG